MIINMKKSVWLSILMLLPLVASADPVEIDGLYYELSSSDGVNTAEVTSSPDKYSGYIVIPESVVYGDVAYSVTSIGVEAFRDCIQLYSITIPNSVTSIKPKAFAFCGNLTTITIPDNLTFVGEYAFHDTAWLNMQPKGLVYVGKVAHFYKGDAPEGTAIDIKEGTVSISNNAFLLQKGVVSVTMPNSVTSIGEQAFSHCYSLETLVLSEKLTYIGFAAFDECDMLTTISIPEKVTDIASSMVAGCSKLETVRLPKSITKIGHGAFAYCKSLKEFYLEATEVPTTNKQAFYDAIIENATLYVPESSVDLYKTTVPWSGFGKILPDPTTGISKVEMQPGNPDAFYNLNGHHVDNPSKGLYIHNGKKVVIK